MRDQDLQPELNPGKGINFPMTTNLLVFLTEAMSDVSHEWELAEDVDEFWKALTEKWGTEADAGKMGDKTWKAYGTPIRGNELRVSVTRSNRGQLGLDVRLWWS